ncbi:MAG: phage portal protein [Bacteroidota bacterium]|nr:phage portal protein [Bacteroidota bacterium]
MGKSIDSIDIQGMSMDIAKSEPARPSQAAIEDPLQLITNLGFKERFSTVTYDTLKKIAVRNAVVASVVQTRINQVSTFSQPARFTNDGIGYQIRLRDPKKNPTEKQRQVMLALELFLEKCGYNHNTARDPFDTFLRKVLRDSLVYDQLCFEIVPDRVGRPAEFYAVDASTVRSATVKNESTTNVQDYTTLSDIERQGYSWVQVVDGQIIAEFTSDEMAFCVRNPRTDLLVQPYGFSELEMLIHQITSHLWAEEYNSKFFSQGGTTKGILNLKGTDITREQLDSFRRQWMAQVSGMTGAWKTPVVSVEGLEYINVSQSNREMEFEMWMNYLINIVSAVYQVDPAEINFPNRGGAGGGGAGIMEGGMEQRLKNSKDKGLRPLLRFLESVINNNIIYRFSEEYTFNFVGLDQETESEKAELNEKLVRTRKTINEIRKENDEDPIEGGDIILDPTYTNYILQQQQMQQMSDQGGGMDQEGNPTQEPEQEELNPEEQQEQAENQEIEESINQNYNS